MNKWVYPIALCILFVSIGFQQYTISMKDEIITTQDKVIGTQSKTINVLRGMSSDDGNGPNCTSGKVHEPTGAWECKDCSFAKMLGQLCWDGEWLYYGDGEEANKVTWESKVEAKKFPYEPIIANSQR